MRAVFIENAHSPGEGGITIFCAGGKMNLRRAVALAVWWAIPALAWSQQPSEMKPVTDRLAASIYNGPSMTTLGELADGIGGRLTGSPAYIRSTEWAVAKFRSYGIENVRLEPFTIPAGWQRSTANGVMLAPLSRLLNVASLGWVPSTPAGGVRGNMVTVADVAPDALRSPPGPFMLPLPSAKFHPPEEPETGNCFFSVTSTSWSPDFVGAFSGICECEYLCLRHAETHAATAICWP